MSEPQFPEPSIRRYDTPVMDGEVLGSYRLLGKISSGGMGMVYRARHEILGRPAAVKLLKPHLTANEEMVQRFLTEAKASTKIRHPGLVEIFDFGYSEAGFAYLVMELLEGKPLSRALADVERFSEWEAAHIARGIASALKAAHGQGIIHRDLKPDNIFLVPDLDGATGAMRPKILDFGIAKLSADSQSHHTQTGALIGTPLYMAPEQARAASAIDHRADLYSLGCILYELLCGKPPFEAEGAGEIIALHLFAAPEPLTSRIPEISPEMNALVMRLLEKEPHQRFQTANEVSNALTVMLGGRLSNELAAISMSSGVRPALRVPTTLRNSNPSLGLLEREAPTMVPKRRSMAVIAAAVTVLIAAAIVIVVLVARSRGDDTQTKTPPAEPEKPTRIDMKAKQPEGATTPPAPTPPPPPTTPDPPPTKPELKPVPKQPTPPPTKTGPITQPGDGPVTVPPPGPPTPRGPVTPGGSPIETDLEPKKKKEPK